MAVDNTNRFTGKAELYVQARPRYADVLFSYMKEDLQLREGSVVVDVGSGTGIMSDQLLSAGYVVYAVEPNEDMRKQAELQLGKCANFVSLQGEASKIPLEDASVDCVVAAQAFHWFDADAFRIECQRILRSDGFVLLVYNMRDMDNPLTKDLARLHVQFNPTFHGFSNGLKESDLQHFFKGACEVKSWNNDQLMTKKSFIERVLSSSYSPREGDANYERFLEGIEQLFLQYVQDDRVRYPHNTIVYAGKLLDV